MYTGPGKKDYRVKVKKTLVCVSTNDWIKAYARDGDWLLIEYETNSSNGNRMGYVQGKKIKNFKDVSTLPKANIPIRIVRSCVMTDDPNVRGRILLDIPSGTHGTLLCLYGERWGYVEMEIDRVLVRGFVNQNDYEFE